MFFRPSLAVTGAEVAARRLTSRPIALATLFGLVAIAGAALGCQGPPDHAQAPPVDDPVDAGMRPGGGRPRLILLIGDGMGVGQLETASLYRYGERGQLFLESLPVRGLMNTGNLSGTTDSAAAATAMATGVRTWNGVVGQDRDGRPVTNLIERAQALGLATGIVTTSSLPHATPAGFTAHADGRGQYLEIADQQVRVTRPDVMLGGGLRFFLPAGDGSARDDDGLFDDLDAAGYVAVRTAAELAAQDVRAGERLAGVFADEHLEYMGRRAADSTQPVLADMARAALAVLDRDPDGFFLMIEGARIDMASHANALDLAIGETLAFDDTVRAVAEWAADKDDVTIVVTADHETGGLAVSQEAPAGELPQVTWRWGQHTNARVPLYASGPGSEIFAGATRDHTWVHAALAARIGGVPLAPPAPVLVPDGDLGELAWMATTQTVVSGFGPGKNQLDALYLGADAGGLALGIGGLFEWGKNAVVVLVDLDFGAATGVAGLANAVSDAQGKADTILAGSTLAAPPVPGFGADVAVVLAGGADPRLEDLRDEGGLRGLAPAANLPWLRLAANYRDDVRIVSGGAPGVASPAAGLELGLPWTVLYPALTGRVPAGAEIAVAVVLVNDDGGYTANQALPPFPAGTANPGRALTALPGVVTVVVDENADGIGDRGTAPVVIP